MKKFSALALVAALMLSLFALVSCGSTPLDGDDAQAALNYVNEKMDALKSYKADIKMTMNMSGMTLENPMVMYAVKSGDTYNTKTVAESSFMGMTMKEEVITIGNVSYTKTEASGEVTKVKTTVDADESSMTDFVDGDEFKNAKFVSQDKEKGVYVISAEMTEGLEGLIGEEGGTAAVTLTCNKDGLVQKMVIEVTTAAMSVKVEMDLSQYNAVTESIAVPADAAEYIDASEEE